MNDYQTVSLIAGLVMLVAIGARYLTSRPSSRVARDALYWAIIVAVVAIGYGIYDAVR